MLTILTKHRAQDILPKKQQKEHSTANHYTNRSSGLVQYVTLTVLSSISTTQDTN